MSFSIFRYIQLISVALCLWIMTCMILDRQGTWNSRWNLFPLTHNPTKFNGHWRCETGDIHFYEYNVIT